MNGHAHDRPRDHAHHAHHHLPSSQRVLLAALALTLGFALVELIAGWWANSLALIGDAGHMLTDSMALAVGAVAAWASRLPASARLTYGWQRAEVLGALINVGAMYLIVAFVVVASVRRLAMPEPVAGGPVIVVGLLGLGVNLLVFRLVHRGEQTLNTRGALLHVLGDLLGSAAAVASGVVILATGWLLIDPLLSLLVCSLILISSTRLLLDSVNVVMAGVPPGIDPAAVSRAMVAAHPQVVGIHHLHVWTVSSRSRALSAHVELVDFDDWDAALRAITATLHADFGIDHPTLQPEVACVDDAVAC